MESLSNIFMTCGVNDKGEGFITVSAHGEDKTILIGQQTPDEIRKHAMAYLAVAEAADQDAAVLRVIRKLELPDQLAAAIITEIRNAREE